MAVKDIKQYYYTMQAQYLQMKEDISDYDQAFKDGYITEDQLTDLKQDIAKIEENYQRLAYIMYLLDLPNRPAKKRKVNNKKLDQYFEDTNSSSKKVFEENTDTLKVIKEQIKALVQKDGQ